MSSRSFTHSSRNQFGTCIGGRSWARFLLCVRRNAAEYLRVTSFDRCSFCAITSGSSGTAALSACSTVAAASAFSLVAFPTFFSASGVSSDDGGGFGACARLRDVWKACIRTARGYRRPRIKRAGGLARVADPKAGRTAAYMGSLELLHGPGGGVPTVRKRRLEWAMVLVCLSAKSNTFSHSSLQGFNAKPR